MAGTYFEARALQQDFWFRV